MEIDVQSAAASCEFLLIKRRKLPGFRDHFLQHDGRWKREKERTKKNTIVNIQVTEFMNISRPMFELVTKRVHKMLSRPLLFCLLSFNFFLLLSFSPLLLLLFFFFFCWSVLPVSEDSMNGKALDALWRFVLCSAVRNVARVNLYYIRDRIKRVAGIALFPRRCLHFPFRFIILFVFFFVSLSFIFYLHLHRRCCWSYMEFLMGSLEHFRLSAKLLGQFE